MVCLSGVSEIYSTPCGTFFGEEGLTSKLSERAPPRPNHEISDTDDPGVIFNTDISTHEELQKPKETIVTGKGKVSARISSTDAFDVDLRG